MCLLKSTIASEFLISALQLLILSTQIPCSWRRPGGGLLLLISGPTLGDFPSFYHPKSRFPSNRAFLELSFPPSSLSVSLWWKMPALHLGPIVVPCARETRVQGWVPHTAHSPWSPTHDTSYSTHLHATHLHAIHETPTCETPPRYSPPCGCSSLSGLTILLCSDGLSISLWQATGASALKTDKTHWRLDSYLVIDPSLVVWTKDNYSTPVFSAEMVMMRPMPLIQPQITPVKAQCLACGRSCREMWFSSWLSPSQLLTMMVDLKVHLVRNICISNR